MFTRLLGRSVKGEMFLLATLLVQAIHVTVAPLFQLYLAPYKSQNNVAHSLCSLLALCLGDCNRGVDRKRGTESQDMYYCKVCCKILPPHPSCTTFSISISDTHQDNFGVV